MWPRLWTQPRWANTIGSSVSFFSFPVFSPRFNLHGFGWDKIKVELKSYPRIRYNFFFELYGACNSRANLWGRLQHWGGLCNFLWALMMIFLGVVGIVSTRASFQWDVWWQRSFDVALAIYSFFFLFLIFFSLIPLVFMLGFFSSSLQRRKGAIFFPNIYKSIVKVCYFHPKHLIVSQPKQFPKLKCETMNFPIIK